MGRYSQYKSSWQAWQSALSGLSSSSSAVMGVVWGDCSYLQDKVISATRKRLQSLGGMVVTRDGRHCDRRFWSTVLVEKGLDSQPKLFIIESAEKLSIKDFVSSGSSDSTQINLTAGSVHSVLFCLRSQKPYPPTRFLKILPKSRYALPACTLKPYEREDFCQDICRRHGVQLSDQACHQLGLSCGDRLYFIEQTIKKIALIRGAHHRQPIHIGSQELESYLDFIPEAAVFQMTSHLAAGHTWSAQLVLRDLLEHQKIHPVMILGVLHHYVKQIAALAAQSKGVYDKQTIRSEIKHRDYLKKIYAKPLQGVNEFKLARVMVMAARADIHYKTHLKLSSDHTLLVDLVDEISGFCHHHVKTSSSAISS